MIIHVQATNIYIGMEVVLIVVRRHYQERPKGVHWQESFVGIHVSQMNICIGMEAVLVVVHLLCHLKLKVRL